MSAEFKIQPLCRFFGVSRSGFYAWLNARSCPARRHLQNQRLTDVIRRIHREHRGLYGSPKITRALRQEGHCCGHNRVARLMRRDGLRGVRPRGFVPRTTDSNHPNPLAPNLLAQRKEAPSGLNQVWVADITYLPSAEGWLYLAAVMDLGSRKIIGWQLDKHLHTSLPLQALQRAIRSRKPASPLIHHSDRGCQYTSGRYAQALQRAGLVSSMSAAGHCYDNAAMESFWSILKREMAITSFPSWAEARLKLFDYIEIFYNRKRLHSALGYQSPETFESLRQNPNLEGKERPEPVRPLPPFSGASEPNLQPGTLQTSPAR